MLVVIQQGGGGDKETRVEATAAAAVNRVVCVWKIQSENIGVSVGVIHTLTQLS